MQNCSYWNKEKKTYKEKTDFLYNKQIFIYNGFSEENQNQSYLPKSSNSLVCFSVRS
jgi:hypothetical protein